MSNSSSSSNRGIVSSTEGARWEPTKTPIVVLGDVMLDLYITGSVERVSPEAPIPVLRQQSVREVPGGAANVAANIVSLGGIAHLVACAGGDDSQRRLERMLRDVGVTYDFIEDFSRPTTVKTRFVAGQHQLLRLDLEETVDLKCNVEDGVLARVERVLHENGTLILSDYSKGLLTDRILSRSIALAQSRNAKVLVDPKRKDFRWYKGAHYIKPNRNELSVATGLPTSTDDQVAEAARVAVQQTSASLLVTRAEHGMSLAGMGGEIVHLPTHAREVFDVSGAGDTVMAAFALGVHSNWEEKEAMAFANIAAGLSVSRSGTAIVSHGDVIAEQRHLAHGDIGRGMLVTIDEAIQIRKAWRHEGLSVGFTNGCFDILHIGHIKLIREAAQKCDKLIVGLNSDASVRRLKGPTRPVQTDRDRAELLGALEDVGLVVIFPEDTPLNLIEELMPDVLVKGADYSIDQIVGADTVLNGGGQVITVELVPNRSTTRLIGMQG